MNNRQLFLKYNAQTSMSPLAIEIVKAKGSKMWDADGKEYLDIISGISVCNLGHSNERVVDAVKAQAEKFMHVLVYGELVQSPQVLFAKTLSENLPEGLDSVYFTNSGSEATEGALKLAKRITGRTNLIGFNNSYHGSSHGALSVIGDEYWRNAYRPLLPDVLHLQYGSLDALKNISERTACVIVETIQAEMGINVPSVEWMQAVRKRCDETGALLIMDEIQVGLGRTGTLWGFEQFEIVPDILLLGKALGGGMPMGAFIASRELMLHLADNPVLGHITTFGGHPVCCAAGLEALNVLLETKLWEDVKRKEKLFIENLKGANYRSLKSFGLMMAIEFDSFEINKKIVDKCIEKGVFTDWFLFAPQSLRIAPPLIISDEAIIFACKIIKESIAEIIGE